MRAKLMLWALAGSACVFGQTMMETAAAAAGGTAGGVAGKES